jgi:pyridoxal biosynthesis lyase PdxS
LCRHGEIAKIEAAVDDPGFRAVWAFGFTGVGKISTIQEALQRIFEGVSIVRIDVSEGTGFVELALALSASVLHEILPESLSQEQLDVSDHLKTYLFEHLPVCFRRQWSCRWRYAAV